MTESTCVLLPVKSLDLGKGRLRAALPDVARRALNEYFLRRTLETATTFAGPARTAVISECDRVLGIAASYGATTLRQSVAPGLNAAAGEGVAELFRRGAARVLLIPVDLPRLRTDDLAEVEALDASDRSVAICPDHHFTGTNAMLIPAGASMRFRFGACSLALHLDEALRAGLNPAIHVNSRLSHDVDTVEDLRSWLGEEGAIPLVHGIGPAQAQADAARILRQVALGRA